MSVDLSRNLKMSDRSCLFFLSDKQFRFLCNEIQYDKIKNFPITGDEYTANNLFYNLYERKKTFTVSSLYFKSLQKIFNQPRQGNLFATLLNTPVLQKVVFHMEDDIYVWRVKMTLTLDRKI